MFLQDSNPAEISSVRRMQGGNHACKGDRQGLVVCKPPVPLIELRNRRAIKECKSVKVRKRIGNFVILPVNFANAVHRPDLQVLVFQTTLILQPDRLRPKIVINDIWTKMSDAIPDDAQAACQVMRRSQIRYGRGLPDAKRLSVHRPEL